MTQMTFTESVTEEARERWWAAHEWRGRYRCPLCGFSERTRFAFILNHDQPPSPPLLDQPPGRWCSSRHLITCQALWGFREGNPSQWYAATMTLRKMGAARIGGRDV